MDNQAVNLTLVVVLLAAGCAWICLYFSTASLRRLSAWAESRAAAIDYQRSVQSKMLLRLGVTRDREPNPADLEYVGINKQGE